MPVPPIAPAAAPAGPADRLSANLTQCNLSEKQMAGDGNSQVGRQREEGALDCYTCGIETVRSAP